VTRVEPDHPGEPHARTPDHSSRSSLRDRFRGNHLVNNSLYLMLNSGLQAGAGFIFWVISARLFSVSNVGLATALYSAAGVVGFSALLGLNSTAVRYLPASHDRDVLITAMLTVVSGAAALLAALYLVIMPFVSPKLAFVVHQPALEIAFVVLSAIGVVNLLTDSIFIGLRQARFNALVDGGIGGIAKIASSIAIASAGAGAFGLFVASAVGSSAAAVASIVLLLTVDKARPSLRGAVSVLRPLVRFSGANYVGNLLTLLPTFIVPLIVLDRVGVHAAAYYYIAYQMANLLFAGVFAVEQTFLAEGSHADVELRAIMGRSWRLLALFCVPSTALLAVGAHWLLLLFGHGYSANGTDVLIILSLSALPLGVFNWLLTVLRLTGQLRAIVIGNVVFAVFTCVLAYLLAPWGVAVLSLAWLIGLVLASIVVGVPVWRWSRQTNQAPA
jgi:O-antigen/teichoic acid export membrane protein